MSVLPPPGQLIDIGGYWLHIQVQGQGSPAEGHLRQRACRSAGCPARRDRCAVSWVIHQANLLNRSGAVE